MQFPGYWVSGAGSKVWLTPYMFDDTELSPASDFTQAWENGETGKDGFVSHVPEPLINNICDRILRRYPRRMSQALHLRGHAFRFATTRHVALPRSCATIRRKRRQSGFLIVCGAGACRRHMPG